MAVGLVTQCYNVAFPESSESSVFRDSLLCPNSFIHSNSYSTFLLCSAGFNSLPEDDVTFHSQKKKKKSKLPGENFMCFMGIQWILKTTSIDFLFPSFQKMMCLCFYSKTIISPLSWILDSFTLLHRFSLVFCNFYIFVSTDYFLFCILQTYFNFPCLKK